MQGAVSGAIKLNIRLIREGVEELTRRAGSSGDIELERRKISDIRAAAETLRSDNVRLRRELRDEKSKVENMRNMERELVGDGGSINGRGPVVGSGGLNGGLALRGNDGLSGKNDQRRGNLGDGLRGGVGSVDCWSCGGIGGQNP